MCQGKNQCSNPYPSKFFWNVHEHYDHKSKTCRDNAQRFEINDAGIFLQNGYVNYASKSRNLHVGARRQKDAFFNSGGCEL